MTGAREEGRTCAVGPRTLSAPATLGADGQRTTGPYTSGRRSVTFHLSPGHPGTARGSGTLLEKEQKPGVAQGPRRRVNSGHAGRSLWEACLCEGLSTGFFGHIPPARLGRPGQPAPREKGRGMGSFRPDPDARSRAGKGVRGKPLL